MRIMHLAPKCTKCQFLHKVALTFVHKTKGATANTRQTLSTLFLLCACLVCQRSCLLSLPNDLNTVLWPTIYHVIIKNELNLTPLTFFPETSLWGAGPVFTEGLAVANVIRWGEFLQVFNGCSQGQHSHV